MGGIEAGGAQSGAVGAFLVILDGIILNELVCLALVKAFDLRVRGVGSSERISWIDATVLTNHKYGILKVPKVPGYHGNANSELN